MSVTGLHNLTIVKPHHYKTSPLQNLTITNLTITNLTIAKPHYCKILPLQNLTITKPHYCQTNLTITKRILW